MNLSEYDRNRPAYIIFTTTKGERYAPIEIIDESVSSVSPVINVGKLIDKSELPADAYILSLGEGHE